MKKIIYLGIAFVMLFSLAACNTDNGLAKYKADAKATIQDYADAKGQANYCETNWSAICGYVAAGKAAVDEAESKATVDIAVSTAKTAINAVSKEIEMEQIVSIHFFTTESFMPWQDHKFYDFTQLTYSTKRIVDERYNDWDGERDEYAIIAAFTEEQAEAFFKSIKELGIFELEKNYHDDDLLDGWDWCLIITFSNGTTFESGGYVKYPEQENALNEVFLSLTGYKLFTSLWEDSI